jgi:uncharacterized delta-60 repeat protein
MPKPEKLSIAAVRLNADGSVDRAYGAGGVAVAPAPSGAYAFALQPDGKLVVAGEALIAGIRNFAAARFTKSGEPDSGFGENGIARVPVATTGAATGVVVNPDGTIVLAGNAWGTKLLTAAVRLRPDGSLDPSFGALGVSLLPLGTVVNQIVRQPDGRIVLAETAMTAVRINSDGSLDAEFGGTGAVEIPTSAEGGAANAVAVQSDGKLVLAGAAYVGGEMQFAVMRLIGAPPAPVPSAPSSPAPEAPPSPTPSEPDVPAPAPAPGGEASPSPPQTTITAAPRNRSRDRTPTFRFTSDVSASSYECSVDGRRFRSCANPMTLKRLRPGRHTFAVRAVAAGEADASPAKRKFRIRR